MEAVNAEGHSFLTHTSINGHFAIRVAIGSPTTLPDHIDTLWESLRNAARHSGV
jgi:aromatic-L-amino-acid decarboxylase